jgi:broad specificity phosphatase PhoE
MTAPNRRAGLRLGLATLALAALVLAYSVARADSPSDPAAQAKLWALLQGGGQVVLMRHGVTYPETGEAPGARVGDCATQRNLSAAGKAEARQVGAAFRAHQVPVGEVRSSRWCRCLDTARLAFGRVEPWPELEFAGWDDTPEKRRRERALRDLAGTRPARGNTILVSHGFVIGPLVGASPATAEFFVLTPQPDGSFRLAGSLKPSELP